MKERATNFDIGLPLRLLPTDRAQSNTSSPKCNCRILVVRKRARPGFPSRTLQVLESMGKPKQEWGLSPKPAGNPGSFLLSRYPLFVTGPRQLLRPLTVPSLQMSNLEKLILPRASKEREQLERTTCGSNLPLQFPNGVNILAGQSCCSPTPCWATTTVVLFLTWEKAGLHLPPLQLSRNIILQRFACAFRILRTGLRQAAGSPGKAIPAKRPGLNFSTFPKMCAPESGSGSRRKSWLKARHQRKTTCEQVKAVSRNYRISWGRRTPRRSPSKSPRLSRNSRLRTALLKRSILKNQQKLPLRLHPRYSKLGSRESLNELQ